jgi:hypothetical protein
VNESDHGSITGTGVLAQRQTGLPQQQQQQQQAAMRRTLATRIWLIVGI